MLTIAKKKVFHPIQNSFQKIDNCDITPYHITTHDGLELMVHRLCRHTGRPPVMLVHNLGASSEIYTGPGFYNLASYLIDSGYGDIWLLDYRSSSMYRGEYADRNDTVDDIANYDIPAAFELIQKENTYDGIHVIGHCIGSMALAIALAKKNITSVKSFVSATISLYPDLGAVAAGKLYMALPFFKEVMDIKKLSPVIEEMNFQSADYAMYLAGLLGTNQCKSSTCRQLAFMWGDGHESTLFLHDNMDTVTHDNLDKYYSVVPLSYMEHIRQMKLHSAVVSSEPDENGEYINYLDLSGNIDTPMLLLTGKENRIWYKSSQEYHKILNRFFPEVEHELLVIPGYGHSDIFMGKNAHNDVFPSVVKFLDSNG